MKFFYLAIVAAVLGSAVSSTHEAFYTKQFSIGSEVAFSSMEFL